VLAALYCYFSFTITYTKEVDSPAPWWRFWNRKNVTKIKRVVGGNLTPKAQADIKAHPMTVDEYFKGVSFEEDLVWTRQSRGINKVVLFLLYSAFILVAAACLVVPALIFDVRELATTSSGTQNDIPIFPA
jgi:hypothetical protein